jgi:hypothetical protein
MYRRMTPQDSGKGVQHNIPERIAVFSPDEFQEAF